MYSSSVNDTSNSFSNTIINQSNNSYDLEKASISNEYVNEDLNYYGKTEMKINLYNNVLLNKYFDKIKQTCTSRTLSREEQFKYNYRPELLSTDVYGTPSLWYLILKCNSCENMSDFRDLSLIYLPDLSTIVDCLTNEEYILNKDNL